MINVSKVTSYLQLTSYSEQMTPGPPGPWLCYKALYRSLSGQYKCISFRSFHINQNLAAVVLAPHEPHFTLHRPQVLLSTAQIIGETALLVINLNQPCFYHGFQAFSCWNMVANNLPFHCFSWTIGVSHRVAGGPHNFPATLSNTPNENLLLVAI